MPSVLIFMVVVIVKTTRTLLATRSMAIQQDGAAGHFARDNTNDKFGGGSSGHCNVLRARNSLSRLERSSPAGGGQQASSSNGDVAATSPLPSNKPMTFAVA